MMKTLQPRNSGPSAADLRGKLLEVSSSEVYDLIKKEIHGQINNSLTLLMDWWTNVKNEAVIATSIHTGKTSFI